MEEDKQVQSLNRFLDQMNRGELPEQRKIYNEVMQKRMENMTEYTSTRAEGNDIPTLDEMEEQLRRILNQDPYAPHHAPNCGVHPISNFGLKIFQIEPGEFIYLYNKALDHPRFVRVGVCKSCKRFVLGRDEWKNGLCSKCFIQGSDD